MNNLQCKNKSSSVYSNGMFGPNGLLAQLNAEDSFKSAPTANAVYQLKSKRGQDKDMPMTGHWKKRRLYNTNAFQEVSAVAVMEADTNKPINFSPPISVIGLKDLPIVEAAFSIENIQKSIFSQLTLKDLNNCRLACRQWLLYGNSTIDKLPVNNDKKMNPISFSLRVTQFFSWSTMCNRFRPITELTDLMDATGSNTFPCHSFHFKRKNLADEDPEFEEFLTKHGYRIKKLVLEMHYVCDVNPNGALSALIDFVKKLLLKQTPNLHTLCVDIKLKMREGNNIDPIEYNKCERNSSLKFVELKGHAPGVLFECIQSLSPLLEKITCNELPTSSNVCSGGTQIVFSPFGNGIIFFAL